MKKLVVLCVSLATSNLFATGLVMKLYDCKAGTGEDAVSIKVVHVMTSPPGGPVHSSYNASATQSWLGGTHSSGQIDVKRTVVGGVETYRNPAAKFEIEIFGTRGTDPREALAEAEFVDQKTGMPGRIVKRWLVCGQSGS